MKNIFFILCLIVLSRSLTAQIYPFKKDDLWGYMDSTGKEVIAPAYKWAGFFNEGLAFASIGNGSKLGYIDENGKEVIPAKYSNVSNFNEGYASIMEDDDWGVINTKGEMVIEPKFAAPLIFHDGLAKIKLERGLFSKYGFVNAKGDTPIYPIYEKLSDFSEGLCMASKDGNKYGYINTKGEWVIQPTMELGALIKINDEYDFTDKNFSNGYIPVSKDNKYGIMDKTGKMILDYNFEFIGKYAEGLAPARKGDLYGYIDIKGNWIIKPKYNGAEAFSNGLAAVSKGAIGEEKWGFVDPTGKVVIPLTIYDNYNPYQPMVFFKGVVLCYTEKGVLAYINRAGKVIWSSK